jgi:hypothetical protein
MIGTLLTLSILGYYINSCNTGVNNYVGCKI